LCRFPSGRRQVSARPVPLVVETYFVGWQGRPPPDQTRTRSLPVPALLAPSLPQRETPWVRRAGCRRLEAARRFRQPDGTLPLRPHTCAITDIKGCERAWGRDGAPPCGGRGGSSRRFCRCDDWRVQAASWPCGAERCARQRRAAPWSRMSHAAAAGSLEAGDFVTSTWKGSVVSAPARSLR